MKGLSEGVFLECRRRLIKAKEEILNRVRQAKLEFSQLDKTGGDEGDQTMAYLAENDFLSLQSILKTQLLEIELALARMETGNYGICEETDELIEPDRLKALPWTRLSIEGAEIREASKKRFAK